MDAAQVLDLVMSRRRTATGPLVVGISGFCGAGKSTLARHLVEALPGAVRMRGDDFLDPTRSHRRSTDWGGVDRERLVAEVLDPFRHGRTGTFRRFDWATRSLGDPEPLPRTDLLVVDLIGLFHPEALPSLDLTVWCDVELDVAAHRGIERDRRLGRDHERLWHDIWIPNDRDFAERFVPRERADVLYEPSLPLDQPHRVECPGPMTSLSARAESLLALHHRSTPVVLPTVWDAWSARAAVASGFEALTVGSHPLADSLGSGDGEQMSLDDALAGIARIAGAVDVPVSADMESGYDTAPAELVERVLEAGAVGVNIEDTVHSEGRLRGAQEHADYIAGIRRAADEAGVHLVINGRTDAFKTEQEIPDRLAEAITRLNLLEAAGADSLYPVGVPDTATLEALLAAVSTPLNVTAHPAKGAIPDGLGLARLSELGVRRVSFGPLLQAALGAHLDEVTAAWR